MSSRFGVRHVEAIEDAVQTAYAQAAQTWVETGRPANPSAWLYRVARNHLLSELRRLTRQNRLRRAGAEGGRRAAAPGPVPDTDGEPDELLRMLFVCCDEAIPVESQLVLALKILCGFSTGEVALRLFTSEDNVAKRLERARRRLRELPLRTDAVFAEQIPARLPAVQLILYLMFTEGYLSSHPDEAVRGDLCAEAIRLGHLLAEYPPARTPETSALLALMHLHAARMTGRQDDSGGLLLLEEQDRSRWDRRGIQVGLAWLAEAACGDAFSRYHAEAGIAAEHCLAPSVGETRWDRIAECYSLLERHAPSAVHKLNHAVAVAEWQGPRAGLSLLGGYAPPSWLAGSYMWAAVLADLHRRCGNAAVADRYRVLAYELAPTAAVRSLLVRRLQGTPGTTPALDRGGQAARS